MINKVRKFPLSMSVYLNDVKGGDVSDNQDVQRRFCSDNSFINEIAYTILTGDYLPPIILGEISLENGMVQQYIIDAMQRTVALMKIRYENWKITSAIEDSIVEYQTKKTDSEGNIVKDENNAIIWEKKEFDIRNKTFTDLPIELQKKFDSYQLDMVIHEDCTMQKISELIRRYNNHRAMNAAQRAFTYLDTFARKVRTISESNFFKDTMNFSETENKKGTYEKLVCESVMSVFHLDKWKKNPKQMNAYLNENATDYEFDRIYEYSVRIKNICQDRFYDIFVPKDIAVWFAVFDKFTEFHVPDERFSEFLGELKKGLHSKIVDGHSYDSLNEAVGTKDKKLIILKIDLLTKLICEYFKSYGNSVS